MKIVKEGLSFHEVASLLYNCDVKCAHQSWMKDKYIFATHGFIMTFSNSGIEHYKPMISEVMSFEWLIIE